MEEFVDNYFVEFFKYIFAQINQFLLKQSKNSTISLHYVTDSKA